MRARSWSVGVVVALSALLVSSPDASGQDAPRRELPRYRVDVVEYTNAGSYGYDINDRGQVALPSSHALPFNLVAQRWDPREGFLPLASERSLATGINKHGDVTVVHDGDDSRYMSAL